MQQVVKHCSYQSKGLNYGDVSVTKAKLCTGLCTGTGDCKCQWEIFGALIDKKQAGRRPFADGDSITCTTLKAIRFHFAKVRGVTTGAPACSTKTKGCACNRRCSTTVDPA